MLPETLTVEGVGVGVATGIHCPSRIETEFEFWLAKAKSCFPSPLKSPIATETTTGPALTLVEPLKPPKPSPRRIETVPELKLATAKSCLPSALKSPIATERGEEPTLTLVEPLKPPKPSPN